MGERMRRPDTVTHGLVVIAVLLAVIAAALWLRPDFASPAMQHSAYGAPVPADADGPGIPDAGRQRLLMVEELRALNASVKALDERLAAIDKALRGGEYRVQTGEAKGKAEGGR